MITLDPYQRSPDVQSPSPPPTTIPPVLQTTGREAIEVENVRSVVFAMLASDIASMNFSISDERLWRDDVPRHQRRAELLKDFPIHTVLTAPAAQHGCAKS